MFTPRYVKHSKLLLRHSQKYLRYKSDVLSAATREEITGAMGKLREALRQRDNDRIKAEAEVLDAQMHKLTPVTWESHWRENCEVILVAIVVAVGIRSYFLQPFKIPTGSMQPTLNGIIGYPRNEPAPNFLKQAAEFVLLGRDYIDVVSREDDELLTVQQKKVLFFFTFTRLVCRQQTFLVYAPQDILRHDFNVSAGRTFKRGEVIARGAVDTGDQVFVDKFSYNFIKPHRGDVFVFRTNNIPGIVGDAETGQPFYIKRLAGLPGDALRIAPPFLYANGKIAERFGFKRVMEARDGYRGYAQGQGYLTNPDNSFPVPKDGYFALGDNSYNSLDSRYWGAVPEENLVGRGLLVYWPFNRHWGLIR
ncbi:MAG: signal peptidase I [Verrucomicrobiota bacterium]